MEKCPIMDEFDIFRGFAHTGQATPKLLSGVALANEVLYTPRGVAVSYHSTSEDRVGLGGFFMVSVDKADIWLTVPKELNMSLNSPALTEDSEDLELAEIDALVNALSQNVRARNTLRSYEIQWRRFEAWMENHHLQTFPADPGDIARYLAAQFKDGKASNTLHLARSAIAAVHAHRGLTAKENPAYHKNVADVLRGIARLAPPEPQARPLLPEDLLAIDATATKPRRRGRGQESAAKAKARGLVDIAICRVISSSGMRRSEIAALTWGQVARWEDGTGRITIGRSKSNQIGILQTVAINAAAIESLEAIRPEVLDPRARVFNLTDRQIARRIQQAAAHAGLGEGFSGHSGRVGMVRTMTSNGAPLATVMRQGRWTKSDSVSRYNRNEEASVATAWL